MFEALCGPTFEPIQSADMKCFLYKTAVLLALTSAKRVEDLHALSVHHSCTHFFPLLHSVCIKKGSKVTLCPNAAYLSKVISSDYSSVVLELLSFYPPSF